MKETDEQPDEEAPRMRCGRVPCTVASIPVWLGCAMLLAHGDCAPAQKLSMSQSSGLFYGGSITKA